VAGGIGGLDKQRCDINVTPLIDVLLVLLVIFMIITPVLTKAMHTDVPPKTDQPLPPEYAEKQLVLTITADGSYRLNTEEIGLGHLAGRLTEVLTLRGGGKVIFINAENSVPYGLVVQAMDICWGAGAESVSIVTEALQAPAPATSPAP